MGLSQIRKDYISFLENISKNLLLAKILLNKEYLDYSFQEIENFNSIYLSKFKYPESIGFSKTEFTNLFYSYLGTAFINYNGGKWELCTTKTDEAYGTPTIINWGEKDYDWIRISLLIWRTKLENGKLGNVKNIFT